MNWLLIKNTAIVGSATTALSVTLGAMAAMFLRGLTGRARQGVITFAIIALALPPFLVTNCWLHYLGAGGAWGSWLPFHIFSLGGTIWILVLLTWPISLILCESALKHLDAPLLEGDPAVSGWGLIWKLVLPMLHGAMGLAAIVIFVLAANNFSVPAILQVKVLPAEAWLRFNTELDNKGSLLMSLPLVIIALALVGAIAARPREWRRASQTNEGQAFRRQLGRPWFWYCGAVTVFLCVASVGIPLFQIASLKRTWTEMPLAIAAGKAAIGNSFVLSAVAATLVIAIGIATSVRQLGEQRHLAWIFGQTLWLPFLAPGVLIGMGLIAVFNRPFLSVFYQSSGVVLLAFTIRYLAIGWNGAAHAFRSVDRDLADVGRLEGATTGELFRLVHWPQIAPQLAAVWYVVFLLCLWDVEAIILVIPPGGQTLATMIFNLLHYGYNAQVNALCFTLLMVALAPMFIWKTWKGASRVFHRIGTS